MDNPPTYADLQSDAETLAEKALEAVREYAEHQSWRCAYPERDWYLVNPRVVPPGDCPCGLLMTLHRLGIEP